MFQQPCSQLMQIVKNGTFRNTLFALDFDPCMKTKTRAPQLLRILLLKRILCILFSRHSYMFPNFPCNDHRQLSACYWAIFEFILTNLFQIISSIVSGMTSAKVAPPRLFFMPLQSMLYIFILRYLSPDSLMAVS